MKCDCCGQPAPEHIEAIAGADAYICGECSGLTMPQGEVKEERSPRRLAREAAIDIVAWIWDQELKDGEKLSDMVYEFYTDRYYVCLKTRGVYEKDGSLKPPLKRVFADGKILNDIRTPEDLKEIQAEWAKACPHKTLERDPIDRGIFCKRCGAFIGRIEKKGTCDETK